MKLPRGIRVGLLVISALFLAGLLGFAYQLGYQAGASGGASAAWLWLFFWPNNLFLLGLALFAGLWALSAMRRRGAVFAQYRQARWQAQQRPVPPIFYEWHNLAHERQPGTGSQQNS
jgi:hypothetical protein